MLTKEKIKKTINTMPESFSIDYLIDELIFTEKVNTGLEQSIGGDVLNSNSAKTKLKKWLK